MVVMLLFFLSGFAGLIEKIHQSTEGRNEKAMFLFISYLMMFAVSTCGRLFSKNKNRSGPCRTTVAYGGISGIVIGFYTFINLTLAGNLNSVVYYPIANGGAILLTVTVSLLAFKEKFSKKYMLGIITGFLSILLLSIPI